MKILVAGGAGYVGSILVPELLSLGHQVKVFDLFMYGDHLPEHPNMEKIRRDIRNPEAIALALCGCDTVIHLACISNDPSFDLNPELGKSINFDCFEPFVRASLKAGVSRFIYASSSSVYGVKDEPDVTEYSSLSPLTDYSKYKSLCEEVLLRYQSPVFCPVILRPATVCGYSPRQRFDLVVNILTNQAVNTKEIKIFGGSQQRPNIHINDMVRAYITVLNSSTNLIRGEIFNVGADNMTVTEIADTVKNEIDPKMPIVTTHSDDNRSYRISSKKIRNKLNFFPQKTVRDAIKDLRVKFSENAFVDSLKNPLYFNIKRMQELNLQ